MIPPTFNDDKHVVALFNVVVPDTFNDDKCVDAPWNTVIPDTFNDDKCVDELDYLNYLINLILPFLYLWLNHIMLNLVYLM